MLGARVDDMSPYSDWYADDCAVAKEKIEKSFCMLGPLRMSAPDF